MHDTAKGESYGPGHLTFDCPWCGAISGVRPELVGEHFECVECGKETKLTEQNTRHAHIFEPPKDAPHLDDAARPFGCPWCGHHEEIAPTHLGEYYDCPECHKRTKLTSRTLPSPEAVAEQAKQETAKPSRAPLVLAALVVVVGVVVFLLSQGGDDGGTTTDEGGRRTAAVDEASTDEGTTPEAPEGGGTEEPASTTPEAEQPTAEPTVEEAPKSVARKLAEARLAKAVENEEAARAALDALLAERPELVEATAAQAVRESLLARTQELRGEARASPAEVRAFNETVQAFVATDPARVAVAEALATALAKQPVRPLRSGSWKELNFHQPRLLEILENQVRDGRARMAEEYVLLEGAWQRAVEAAREARAVLDATPR